MSSWKLRLEWSVTGPMSKVEEARRRRDDKLRATRGRQNLILALIVLSITLIVVGGYYLLHSDLWLLKTVSITGNKHVSAEKITKLSGLDEDTNLMRAIKDKLEAAIEEDPWIAEAVVTRDLPSRIEIAVTERVSFARVKQKGKLYTLDKWGYVLEVGDDPRFDKVPVINKIEVGRLIVGRRTKSKLLQGSLKSLASVAPKIREKVIWISVPSLDKLAFHTSDDIEIIYGSTEKSGRKNTVIERILADGPGNIVHINVTVPESPVVRSLQT